MKKLLSTVLALVFIISFAMIPAEAKILHQCHVCYGTGKYKCDASDCVNGMIPCGKCNSTGTEKEQCAECGGTGICRMCQGSKTITDQNGETRECGHCHGSGKCQGGPEKALAQMVIISTHVLTVAVKAPKCMTVSGANMLSHTMVIAPYAKVQDMRVTE